MTETKKLEWVDALRGIAILGVIVTHMQLAVPHRMVMFTSMGAYGVQLFFVASAFTLVKSRMDRRTEANPLRNFFLRRFFRIAPLYYAMIPVYLLIRACDAVSVEYYIATDWKSILTNLFFVHGWFPSLGNGNWSVPGGWSICTEMGFYALLPLVGGFSATWRRAIVFIVLAMAFSVLAVEIGYGLYAATPAMLERNAFFYFWLPSQLPVFGFGFLLHAFLAKKSEGASKTTQSIAWLILASGLFFALVWSSWHGSGLSIFAGLAFAGAISFCLGASLALHPWRLLVNPLTTFLGKHSFSIYIVHFPAVWWICAWVNGRFHPTSGGGQIALFAAALLVVLVCATAAAVLTHRFIELPGIALGKRLIARLEARAAAKAAKA